MKRLLRVTLLLALTAAPHLCAQQTQQSVAAASAAYPSQLTPAEQEAIFAKMKKADNYKFVPKEILSKIKPSTIIGKKHTPKTHGLFNDFERAKCDVLYVDDDLILFLHMRERNTNNKRVPLTFIHAIPRKISTDQLLHVRKPFKVEKTYFPLSSKYISRLKKEGAYERMAALSHGLNLRLQAPLMVPAIKVDLKKSMGKFYDVPVLLNNTKAEFEKSIATQTLESINAMPPSALCQLALGPFVNSLKDLRKITKKNGILFQHVMENHSTVVFDIKGKGQHEIQNLSDVDTPYTISTMSANFKRLKDKSTQYPDEHDLYPLGMPVKRYVLDSCSRCYLYYASLLHNYTFYYEWVKQQQTDKPTAEFELLTDWYHALTHYYQESCLKTEKGVTGIYGQYGSSKHHVLNLESNQIMSKKGAHLGKELKFRYNPTPR